MWKNLFKISGLAVVGIFFLAVGMSAFAQEKLTIYEDAYPYWHPDGTKIVFHSSRFGGVDQVFVRDLDGTNEIQLTFTEGANRTPVYSPDGTKIAFQSERDGVREIYVMNADGSNQTRLTVGTEESSHPKWSAHGKEIIFDSHRDHPETQLANLYIMTADGSNVRRLTTYDEYDSYASLSPDGSKILFRRVVASVGEAGPVRNSEVFLMDRDGSRVTNLSNHPAFDGYPSWSPDGQWVLFASNRDADHRGEANIFAVRPDGTGLVQLAPTQHRVWQARQMVSPDGLRVVFNRDYPDGQIEITVLDFLPLE